LPVLAIGGITPDKAEAVRKVGAAGVAVIAAVIGAPDPAAVARQLRDTMQQPRSVPEDI
jgi:thiamine monophosphate synthase